MGSRNIWVGQVTCFPGKEGRHSASENESGMDDEPICLVFATYLAHLMCVVENELGIEVTAYDVKPAQ